MTTAPFSSPLGRASAQTSRRHKPKRTPGRQKGDATPKAEIERQENIKEAMEYRLMRYTYPADRGGNEKRGALHRPQVGLRRPGGHPTSDGRGAAHHDDGAVQHHYAKAHAADGGDGAQGSATG